MKEFVVIVRNIDADCVCCVHNIATDDFSDDARIAAECKALDLCTHCANQEAVTLGEVTKGKNA